MEVPVVVEVPGKPGRWRRIRWRRGELNGKAALNDKESRPAFLLDGSTLSHIPSRAPTVPAGMPPDGKPNPRGPRIRRGWLRRRRAPGVPSKLEEGGLDGKDDDEKIPVVVIEDDRLSRTSCSA